MVSQAMTTLKARALWITVAVLVLLSLNAAFQVVNIRHRQTSWLPEAAATQWIPTPIA